MNIRYEDECKMLSSLARRQLNLEKNKSKEDFEDLSIESICNLIHEEMLETIEELYEVPWLKLKESVDYDKLLFELGDLSACIVGMIAWINKHRSSK